LAIIFCKNRKQAVHFSFAVSLYIVNCVEVLAITKYSVSTFYLGEDAAQAARTLLSRWNSSMQKLFIYTCSHVSRKFGLVCVLLSLSSLWIVKSRRPQRFDGNKFHFRAETNTQYTHTLRFDANYNYIMRLRRSGNRLNFMTKEVVLTWLCWQEEFIESRDINDRNHTKKTFNGTRCIVLYWTLHLITYAWFVCFSTTYRDTLIIAIFSINVAKQNYIFLSCNILNFAEQKK
jgi:hypothetical protein